MSTSDNELARKIRNLISLGIDKSPWKRNSEKFTYKYDLKYPGYKFNFTDLQASIGIEQLKKINKIISKRKKIRRKYDSYLKPLVKKNLISLFRESKNTKSAEYIYTILIKNRNFSRDKLIQYLNKKKISTSVHYIPALYLTYYKKMFKSNNLNNTKFAYKNIVSIPFHNNLKESDIKYISKEILNFFKI